MKPQAPDRLSVVDMHTAGEPVRIVTSGYPRLEGGTILDKRRDAAARHDQLRRRLMLEPRGHAGMYGVIPTEPCDPRASVAVLFTHASGYSTMCGHATIAIARWALDEELVSRTAPRTEFILEAPCGLIDVFIEEHADGRTTYGFDSVPAFAEARSQFVETRDFGRVEVDIAFGGAFYAILPASRMGLSFEVDGPAALAAAAASLHEAARRTLSLPGEVSPDLKFLYGVILTSTLR